MTFCYKTANAEQPWWKARFWCHSLKKQGLDSSQTSSHFESHPIAQKRVKLLQNLTIKKLKIIICSSTKWFWNKVLSDPLQPRSPLKTENVSYCILKTCQCEVFFWVFLNIFFKKWKLNFSPEDHFNVRSTVSLEISTDVE